MNKKYNNHIVIYDCWTISDIDRRSSWIRQNVQRDWLIEIDYVDDIGVPIYEEDNDDDDMYDVVVDTVTIHFEKHSDLMWFKLMWVL